MKLNLRKHTFRNGETARIIELSGNGWRNGLALFPNRLVISFGNFYKELVWSR